MNLTQRLAKWAIITVFCLAIAAYSMGRIFSVPAPIFTTAPNIILDPNLNTPLAGLLTLTTDVPTRIDIEINSSKKNWAIKLNHFAIKHTIPVLGFRPDTTHILKIHATTDAGATATFKKPLTVTTNPIPNGFPSITVTSEPEKMEPGYTLVEVIPEARKNKEFGAAIIIVNNIGEIVWYTTGSRFTDVRQLANGNLLYLAGNKARIMNMTGDIIKEWRAYQTKTKIKGTVATRVFHHELFPMENGNFLALSIEAQDILNFPTSETDAKAPKNTALVAGDLVVEFDPEGNIVNSWSMLQMLQPQRIGFGSLGSYWNFIFGGKETRDWSHANAVTHQASDDSIIVSLRHQDATVKFSRKTGEIIWILSPHSNWDEDRFNKLLLKPKVDDKYFFPFHHHAHEITPNGNLMLYDNGSYGTSPFSTQPRRTRTFSRAVEYKINEKTKQAEIVWQYGQHAKNVYYSGALGDADYLPQTNNVLITHGSLVSKKEKTNSAVILEVTHTTPGKEVFKMTVYDKSPEPKGGWRVYRAERIPDLYSLQSLTGQVEE